MSSKKAKIIQLPLSPERYIMQKARHLPLHECFINQDWKQGQMASIFISRRMPSGKIIAALYLVDLMCLGLKDAYYEFNLAEDDYEEFKKSYRKELDTVKADYVLAHNIIYGGIEFAEEFGFRPHKNFRVAQYLLQEDDKRVELMDIEFGKDGMPVVMVYPHNPQRNVIAQLDARVGKGNYEEIYVDDEYLTPITQRDLPDDDFENEDYEEEYIQHIDEDGEEEQEEADFENMTENEILRIMRSGSPAEQNILFPKYMDLLYREKCEDELPQAPPEPKALVHSSYGITWDRMESEYNADEKISDRLSELYVMSNDNPKQALKEVEAEITKHPHIPILYNYLSVVYTKLKMASKAKQALMDCYHKFPDYFFGKLNYADHLLQNGCPDEVPKIMENKYDLKQLYPERETFHISEVVGFCSLMCRYFIAKDNIRSADVYWKLLEDIGKKGVNKNQQQAIDAARSALILIKGEKVFGKNVLAEERISIFNKMSDKIKSIFR